MTDLQANVQPESGLRCCSRPMIEYQSYTTTQPVMTSGQSIRYKPGVVWHCLNCGAHCAGGDHWRVTC